MFGAVRIVVVGAASALASTVSAAPYFAGIPASFLNDAAITSVDVPLDSTALCLDLKRAAEDPGFTFDLTSLAKEPLTIRALRPSTFVVNGKELTSYGFPVEQDVSGGFYCGVDAFGGSFGTAEAAYEVFMLDAQTARIRRTPLALQTFSDEGPEEQPGEGPPMTETPEP